MEDLYGAIRDLELAVTTLSNDVSWLRRLGKWVVGTAVTAVVLIIGTTATFTYKAVDVYAQVAKNTEYRQALQKHEQGDLARFRELEEKYNDRNSVD